MKTILIIEDNLEIRENTAEILELSGFEVLMAGCGKEGLELASNKMPDLVLCDIMMPRTNGYEVLQDLKNSSLTAQIPFIYLTAKAEKSEVKMAMDLGADAYLCKPFDVMELMGLIHKFLPK